jgi:ribosomal protein S27E
MVSNPMNRTKCPTCQQIQTVRSKENKVFMTCKKCQNAFVAERMGHKYKEVKKRAKRNPTTI